MEAFPKDVQEKILNELSPEDFVRLCGKKGDILSEKICNDNEVWFRRLHKDFGFLSDLDYLSKRMNQSTNYKNLYLQVFSEFSKAIENIHDNIIKALGDGFMRFINKEYFSTELSKVLRDIVMEYLLGNISDTTILGKISDNSHVDALFRLLPYYSLNDKEYMRLLSWDTFVGGNLAKMKKNILKLLAIPLKEKVENLSEDQLLDISIVDKNGSGSRVISPSLFEKFKKKNERFIKYVPGTKFIVVRKSLEGLKNTAKILDMHEILESFSI